MNTIGDYFQACSRSKQASIAQGGVWYSEPEVRLSEALTARGFCFEQQKRLEAGTRVAVLDFFVEGTLAVEVDGRQFHDSVKDSEPDYLVRRAHGIPTLRIAASRVMQDAGAVVCAIALQLLELEIVATRSRVTLEPEKVMPALGEVGE